MIRLGRVNTTLQPTTTNFVQFDVIKQDITDDSNIAVGYNKHGSWSITGTPRITANLEFDFLTRAQLTSLKDILYGGGPSAIFSPAQLFLQLHPSTSDMFVDFNNIAKPSSTQTILQTVSDADNLAYGGTELTTAQYQNIYAMQQPSVQYIISNNNTHAYSYNFFKMGPTYDMTNQQPKRVTFCLYNPWNYDSTEAGFKIDIYDQVYGTWSEISRINWTLAGTALDAMVARKKNFYCSVVKPVAGFSSLINYHGDGYFYFRMRNIFPRKTGQTIQLGFGYPFLIVDGIPVVMNGDSAFNFRDSFTGTGYTGSLQLKEI